MGDESYIGLGYTNFLHLTTTSSQWKYTTAISSATVVPVHSLSSPHSPLSGTTRILDSSLSSSSITKQEQQQQQQQHAADSEKAHESSFLSNDNNKTIQTTEKFQKQMVNARKIARRLAASTSSACQNHIKMTTTTNQYNNNNNNYRQRREKQQQREKQKLQKCLLKNLNYLANKDNELHQLQLKTLQDANDYLSIYNNKKNLNSDTNTNNNPREKQKNRFGSSDGVILSTSGIGTQERKNQVKYYRKNHQGHLLDEPKKCAIYITGLPQKTTATGQQEKENNTKLKTILRQVFGSYGRKVHQIVFYTDKKTGCQKGDGLILFSDNDDDKNNNKDHTINSSSFLDTVCTQLNGVELPCGSILSAEPADMNYNDSNNNNEKVENKIDSTKVPMLEESRMSDDKDYDLDDFFASLE